MKKIVNLFFKLIALCLIICFSFLQFYGNGILYFITYYLILRPDGATYPQPDFKTQYTKEEHFERIWDLTVERFKEDFDNGKIKSLYVDIVHAFYDDDPEYFLVEIEFYEEFTKYNTDNQHIITTNFIHAIGYIYNDAYWSTRTYTSYKLGKSAYSTYSSREYKKYYGNGAQAVLIDGKLIQVYDTYCTHKYPEIHDLFYCRRCETEPYLYKEVDSSKLEDYMLNNGQAMGKMRYPFTAIS